MNFPIIVLGDQTGKYISGIESQRGNVSVARHVHEIGEMLGIAQSGIAKAVLVVSGREEITASLISSLHEMNILVLIVQDIGIDPNIPGTHSINSLAEIDEVISSIETAISRGPEQNSTTLITEQAQKKPEPAVLAATKNAEVIVFWGPQGSPGKSTICANLAASYSAQGQKVCVIDADTVAPAQSVMFGMLEDFSTLTQLCHLADRGKLDTSAFAETISTISCGKKTIDIATGITRPDRWPEVRSNALEAVIDRARELYDVVLIDTQSALEADEELSFDGVAPLRNASSRTVLEHADQVITLGTADAVGIPRLIKALAMVENDPILAEHVGKFKIWINKVSETSSGSHAQESIQLAWERFGPRTDIQGFIPLDFATADKALLLGQAMVEMAPKAEISRAIQSITGSYLTQTESQDSEHNGTYMMRNKAPELRWRPAQIINKLVNR